MMASSSVKLANSKSYDTFMKGLKSKETQATYRLSLIKYMEFAKAENPDELVTRLSSPTVNEIEKKRAVESSLRDWIFELRNNKDISANSIRRHIHAVASFYTINDVVELVNFKKLWRFLPENHKAVEDRAYSVEEIAKMLETASERLKVAILLMSSAGLRLGALPELKLYNLEPIEDFYRITVYAGYNEQYFTYCTPECRKAIDNYLEQRRRLGETISKYSTPILREGFDIADRQAANNPKPVSRAAIKISMWRNAFKNGLRQQRNERKRTSVYLHHGLRKFFRTRCEMAGVRPIVIEELMGHTTGLAGKYFRPTDNEKLQEYKKAINDLTINEENKLRLKLEEEKTIHEQMLQKLTSEIDSIKEAMAKVIAKGELKPL